MTEPHTNIGDPPVIDWIDKNALDVDPLYQRPEDEKRVAKIVSTFRWDRFGAVVLAPKPDGRFNIIDGQHRARAAQMHPEVSLIPAVIIVAKDVSAEASSFVGINAQRKNTSSLELFFAQLAAGDEDAETIRQVCDRAGVRVPKYPSASYRPADTIAIAAVQTVIGRHGVAKARHYLEILAKADLAPIKAEHLKAVESLMAGPEFAGQIDGEDLTATILSMGAAAETQAKAFAATHCVPAWKGLASTWFQKCRKRRGSAKLPEQIPPASKSATTSKTEKVEAANLFQNGRGRPASGEIPRSADTGNVSSMERGVTTKFRTIVPHATSAQRVVTSAVLGDPAPGRSALDQRGRA